MKLGGEAVGSGSYGCVFRPSLKCANKENRTSGVSKLMINRKAKDEFDEIVKFVPIIKKIENNNDYFLIPNSISQYTSTAHKFNPKTNLLLFFPSYLKHKIMYHQDRSLRYSLSFNIVPTGSYGLNDSAYNTGWLI